MVSFGQRKAKLSLKNSLKERTTLTTVKIFFTFYNFATDVEIKTTRFLFKKENPGTDFHAMLDGISSKNWVIMEAVDEARLEAIISGFSGKYNHHADPKIYTIVNLKN